MVIVDKLRRRAAKSNRSRGAFYLMVEIAATGKDSYSFAKELVQATGVAAAPGKTFGPSADNYIRMFFCAEPAKLQQGLRRFSQFYHDRCRR